MSLFHPDAVRTVESLQGNLLFSRYDTDEYHEVPVAEVSRCAVAVTLDGDVVLEIGTRAHSVSWVMSTELAVALADLLVRRMLEGDE